MAESGFDPYAAYAQRKIAEVTAAPKPRTSARVAKRTAATAPTNQTLVGGHLGVGGVPARRSTAPVTSAASSGSGSITKPPSVTPPVPDPYAGMTNQEMNAAKAAAAGVAEEPVAPVYNDSLSGFTEADINASLAAIEAEYGLTREELLRDQTMIGAQYRLLTAQLARQRQLALEGAEAGALQRGLFRSGIFAAQAGDVETQFGEAQAQLAQETLGKEGEIISQLETLDARRGNAQAQEETQIRRKEYEARLAAAGL